MNNKKEAERLMFSIVEQWGNNTLKVYEKLQKELNYPPIESKQNKEIYRGRFYALAFGYILENYIEKMSNYIYFDGYFYTSSLVGFKLTQDTKSFLSEIGINHLDYKEDFWNEKDNWPEYEFHDMYTAAHVKLLYNITADMVNHFGTKENVMAFLFEVFNGFVQVQKEQYVFYANYSNTSEGSIVSLTKKELKAIESEFYDTYFK